jgi:hypothetical protein
MVPVSKGRMGTEATSRGEKIKIKIEQHTLTVACGSGHGSIRLDFST